MKENEFSRMPILTSKQVRQVDRIAIEEFHMRGIVLMENAGRNCAEVIASRSKPADRIVVLCGPGNNGGDGLVIARHLEILGFDSRVYLFGDRNRLSPDCAENLQIMEASHAKLRFIASAKQPEFENLISDLQNAAAIVDALLGTGSQGAPREPMAEAIQVANKSNANRIAIDLPTGLDADSGVPYEPTFQASLTCTLVALKPGLIAPTAAKFVGEIIVLSIGVPLCIFRQIKESATEHNGPAAIQQSPETRT